MNTDSVILILLSSFLIALFVLVLLGAHQAPARRSISQFWRILRYRRYYSDNLDYADETVEVISRHVFELEREVGVVLTKAAHTVLVAPLLEYADWYGRKEFLEPSNREEWRKSVRSILEYIKEDRSYFETERQFSKSTQRERISSFSVLQAFHNRWCGIPPFCRRINQ